MENTRTNSEDTRKEILDTATSEFLSAAQKIQFINAYLNIYRFEIELNALKEHKESGMKIIEDSFKKQA